MNHEGHRLGFEFHLSATLGYFHSNKEGIIHDLKVYASKGSSMQWQLPLHRAVDFPFPMVSLDPTQHESLPRPFKVVNRRWCMDRQGQENQHY
jgi:hypothetical protein